MSWSVWAAAVCLLGVGCNDGPERPPEGVMDAAAFAQVLAEVQLLEAGAKKRLRRDDEEDAIYRGQYLAIFDAHGITEEVFRSSHAWWFAHPDRLVAVYDDVIEQLNAWEQAWGEEEGQAPGRNRK